VLDVREHLRDSQIIVRFFPLLPLSGLLAGKEASQRDQTSGDAIPTHTAHSSAAGFWTRRHLQSHICHLSSSAAALTAATKAFRLPDLSVPWLYHFVPWFYSVHNRSEKLFNFEKFDSV